MDDDANASAPSSPIATLLPAQPAQINEQSLSAPTPSNENQLVERLVLSGLPVAKYSTTTGQFQYKLAQGLPPDAVTPSHRTVLRKELETLIQADARAQQHSAMVAAQASGARPGSVQSMLVEMERMQHTHRQAKMRALAHLHDDQMSVLLPDLTTPFRDFDDVLDRLLPYHVFLYPEADLDVDVRGFERDCQRNTRHFTAQARRLNERLNALHQRLGTEESFHAPFRIFIERLALRDEVASYRRMRNEYNEAQRLLKQQQFQQHQQHLPGIHGTINPAALAAPEALFGQQVLKTQQQASAGPSRSESPTRGDMDDISSSEDGGGDDEDDHDASSVSSATENPEETDMDGDDDEDDEDAVDGGSDDE